MGRLAALATLGASGRAVEIAPPPAEIAPPTAVEDVAEIGDVDMDQRARIRVLVSSERIAGEAGRCARGG